MAITDEEIIAFISEQPPVTDADLSAQFNEFEKQNVLTDHITTNLATTHTPDVTEVETTKSVIDNILYYNNEVGKGMVLGASDSIISAGKFIADVYDATDARRWLDDAQGYLDERYKVTSTVGEVVDTVTQVGVGLALTRNVGSLGTTATSQLGARMGQGALVDGIFFDENSNNIFDVAKQFGFNNELVDYLRGDDTDSSLESRLKNTIAGAFVGGSVEAIFSTFKYGKSLFKEDATKLDDATLVNNVIQTVKQDVEEVATKVSKFDIPPKEAPKVKVDTTITGATLISKADELIAQYGKEADIVPPLNPSNLGVDEGTFVRATADVEANVPVRTFDETMSLVDEQLKKNLSDDAYDVVQQFTSTSSKLENLDVELGQQRVILATLTNSLEDSIKVAQKEAGGASTLKVIEDLETVIKVSTLFKDSTTSIARTLANYRNNPLNSQLYNSIKILDAIDPEASVLKIQQALKDNDAEGLAKLLDDLLDPTKKMKDHIENYQDGWFTKLSNVLSESTVANMLSSPSTLFVNTIGGFAVKHLKMLEDVLTFSAGYIRNTPDRMKSRELRALLVANAGHNFKDMSLVINNVKNWAKSGFKDETFDSAILARYIQDQDFQHAYTSSTYIRGINKGSTGSFVNTTINTLGKIVRLPYRTIGAVDDYYKRGAFRSELIRQGTRAFEAKGLPDSSYNTFIEKFIRANTELQILKNNHVRPTKEFLKDYKDFIGTGKGMYKYADMARENANYMTFQAELTGRLGKGVDLLNSHGLLRILVPFKLTPINLLKHSASIAGAPLRAKYYKDITAGGIKGDIAIAKLGISSIILTGLGFLATSGNMTGSFDKNMRSVMQDAGIPEFSYKIGNTWHEYKQVEPFATIAGFMADIHRITSSLGTRFEDVNNDDVNAEIQAVLADLGLALAENITSKSYFKSLADALALVTGDKNLVDVSGNLISSMAPLSSLASFTGRVGGDDIKKEADTFLEKIRSKYKGTLDRDALDSFGRPMKDIEYSYLLTKKVEERPQDAFVREMARLEIPTTKLPRNIVIAGQQVSLNTEEYWNMRRSMDKKFMLSNRLNALIKTQNYLDASDFTRTKMLENVINIIRNSAIKDVTREQRIKANAIESSLRQKTSVKAPPKQNYNNMIIQRIESE